MQNTAAERGGGGGGAEGRVGRMEGRKSGLLSSSLPGSQSVSRLRDARRSNTAAPLSLLPSTCYFLHTVRASGGSCHRNDKLCERLRASLCLHGLCVCECGVMSDLFIIIPVRLCVCRRRRGSGAMPRSTCRASGELVLQGREGPQVIKEVLVVEAGSDCQPT